MSFIYIIPRCQTYTSCFVPFPNQNGFKSLVRLFYKSMAEILQMDFTLLTCSILLSLEFKLASIKTGNAKLEFSN